jgi:hypothetical protein
MIPLVLGQAVGAGKIVGGWEYVIAAYVLTLLGIVVYSASLWVRRPKE